MTLLKEPPDCYKASPFFLNLLTAVSSFFLLLIWLCEERRRVTMNTWEKNKKQQQQQKHCRESEKQTRNGNESKVSPKTNGCGLFSESEERRSKNAESEKDQEVSV